MQKKNSFIFLWLCLFGNISFSQIDLIDNDVILVKGISPLTKQNYLMIGDTSKIGLMINLTKKESIETIQTFKKGKLNGFSFKFKNGSLTESIKFNNGELAKIDSSDYSLSLSNYFVTKESRIDSIDYSINIQNQANSTIIVINSLQFEKNIVVVFYEGKLSHLSHLNLKSNVYQFKSFRRWHKKYEITSFEF